MKICSIVSVFVEVVGHAVAVCHAEVGDFLQRLARDKFRCQGVPFADKSEGSVDVALILNLNCNAVVYPLQEEVKSSALPLLLLLSLLIFRLPLDR